MESDELKILNMKHIIKPNTELIQAAQTQQNSTVREKVLVENLHPKVQLKNKPNQDNFYNGSLIPSLCISKQEYEKIVNKRPLIKFRPLRNTLIKSSDKSLLAESLNVSKNDVDKVINETIEFLLYKNPESIYYNPELQLKNYYTEEMFNQIIQMQNISNEEEIKKQKLIFYQQPIGIIGDYVYRHGNKTQLLNYMKLQLSDAKSALKKLYNILETESGSLFSYFVRPIHVLDNHSVLKMQEIIKNGLGEAHKKGYITKDAYNQNVMWALDKIYSIQSNTSLREAFRIVNSST